MLFASTSAVTAAAPVLGLVSLAFGFWYAAAAWSLMPYPFWLRRIRSRQDP